MKRSSPVATEPVVTIQKGGTISLNAPAFAALRDPEAVELLYDRTAQIVGLRAVDPGAAQAYPVRAVQSKNATSYVLSGRAFVKFYGIAAEKARRWRGTLEDGVLCVDTQERPLNDDGEKVPTATVASAAGQRIFADYLMTVRKFVKK